MRRRYWLRRLSFLPVSKHAERWTFMYCEGGCIAYASMQAEGIHVFAIPVGLFRATVPGPRVPTILSFRPEICAGSLEMQPILSLLRPAIVARSARMRTRGFCSSEWLAL